jgi:hypothetical protein
MTRPYKMLTDDQRREVNRDGWVGAGISAPVMEYLMQGVEERLQDCVAQVDNLNHVLHNSMPTTEQLAQLLRALRKTLTGGIGV